MQWRCSVNAQRGGVGVGEGRAGGPRQPHRSAAQTNRKSGDARRSPNPSAAVGWAGLERGEASPLFRALWGEGRPRAGKARRRRSSRFSVFRGLQSPPPARTAPSKVFPPQSLRRRRPKSAVARPKARRRARLGSGTFPTRATNWMEVTPPGS